jgi:hypothetical protein
MVNRVEEIQLNLIIQESCQRDKGHAKYPWPPSARHS